MKIIIGIQARTNSTRLPGKIYKPWADSTILETIFKTCSTVNVLSNAVKTSTVILGPENDTELLKFCQDNKLSCVLPKGVGENDLVGRFLHVIDEAKADAMIRVTSDCPYLHAEMIARAIVSLTEVDYTSNTIVRTYPEGQDVQGASARLWRRINEWSQSPEDREHPFAYFDQNDHLRKLLGDEGFKMRFILNDQNPVLMKTSIDTPQEYENLKPKKNGPQKIA